MKLLELLVQELPPRGGWPEEAKNTIEMHDDGAIFFDGMSADNFHLPLCSDGWRMNSSEYSNTDDGFWSNEVTREQYEEALAASRYYVEWDGQGLPPVGVECDASIDGGESWTSWYTMAEDSGVVIFGYLNGNHKAFGKRDMPIFRPIYTEAQRKRKETTEIIRSNVTNYNKTDVIHAIGEIYDAIAAGKIPGVGLTN